MMLYTEGRVVNTVDVDGSVRVGWGYVTTEVDGTVDVNLSEIIGREHGLM